MDRWNSGAAYEAYVGRWSRMVARDFMTWLSVPSGSRWLDVGCGTGVLSQTILEMSEPRKITGVDLSEAFIGYAREQISDQRVSFEIGSAEALPVESNRYEAVVSGLMLNFVPDQEKAIHEMRRAAAADGVIGVYVWDYADQMQMMRYFWEAAAMISADGAALDEGQRFPMCKPEPLAVLFRDAGLREVEVRAIDAATRFRDFDDYWLPFLGGTGPAPGYAKSLSEGDRERLRERIREMLPIQEDGSVELIARAWAVRGTK